MKLKIFGCYILREKLSYEQLRDFGKFERLIGPNSLGRLDVPLIRKYEVLIDRLKAEGYNVSHQQKRLEEFRQKT